MRFAVRTTTSEPRPRWPTGLLVALIVVVSAATVVLGMRTYRTFTLLSSAYEAGVPEASSVRPWMTLGYIAAAYRVPGPALREHLGLSSDVLPDTTLKVLADRAGISPPEYVRRVQRAMAAAGVSPAEPRSGEAESRLSGLGERLVSAVLVYGYPALGLTLLLGALGAPLPSGLSMIVAGSLAAQGEMSWLLLVMLATAASVAGDASGYGIGRILGQAFLERRGRWFGLTPERRARAERFLARWGALSVLLSRSLVSMLSSAVNLLAGAGRFRLTTFLALGVVGRLAWTLAYLGLGYAASVGLEPAADFLRSLTGLLVSIAVLAGLGLALRRRSMPSKVSP